MIIGLKFLIIKKLYLMKKKEKEKQKKNKKQKNILMI
jgi:hypothetical protein